MSGRDIDLVTGRFDEDVVAVTWCLSAAFFCRCANSSTLALCVEVRHNPASVRRRKSGPIMDGTRDIMSAAKSASEPLLMTASRDGAAALLLMSRDITPSATDLRDTLSSFALRLNSLSLGSVIAMTSHRTALAWSTIVREQLPRSVLFFRSSPVCQVAATLFPGSTTDAVGSGSDPCTSAITAFVPDSLPDEVIFSMQRASKGTSYVTASSRVTSGCAPSSPSELP